MSTTGEVIGSSQSIAKLISTEGGGIVALAIILAGVIWLFIKIPPLLKTLAEQAAAFSPDGSTLVVCGAFTGCAKVYTVSGTAITYLMKAYKRTARVFDLPSIC